MTSNIETTKLLKRYQLMGFSFFHTKSREKKVKARWKHYTKQKPTDLEIRGWLKIPYQNYAVASGEISNIIVFDLDTYKDLEGNKHHEEYLKYDTFIVKSPSGGHHIYFKYTDKLSNIIHQGQGFLKHVDLQTNASLLFLPPSNFGKGEYKILKDKPIIDVPDELLNKVLEQINKDTAEEEKFTYKKPINQTSLKSQRPGDILNVLATWSQVLEPLGWKKLYSHDSVDYWQRPGKDRREGISASTNYKGYDLFFPFTTHYAELQQKKGYTKFGLYTALVHDGDFRKASNELVMKSFRL